MQHKTCSVVIATYNGEKYISEQLQSIIKQTRIPDYILVSDDLSKDNTTLICEKILSKSGIKYDIVVNEYPKGVSINFIQAARMTQTDVVFFSDQDDIWFSDKIEKMMSIFEEKANCSEVLCNAYIWKCDEPNNLASTDVSSKQVYGKLTGLSKILPFCMKDGEVRKEDFWRIAITNNIATGMSMAITRNVVNTIMDYVIQSINNHSLLMFHDSYYNLVAGAIGEVYVLNQPLVYYRQHNSNVQGAVHKTNISVIKRSGTRVYKSFDKVKERIAIIRDLDNCYSCLGQKNSIFLREAEYFYREREIYIRCNSTFEMIKLAFKNTKFYTDIQLLLRDIYVTAFFRNR